jgi:hypothetical protein
MTFLTQKIAWYHSPEHRKWKRIYHCIELALISLFGWAAFVLTLHYTDSTSLQKLVLLFTGLLSLSAALLVPALYHPLFKRWHIFVITPGLGCGMGLSAVAGLLLLELQLAAP